MSNKLNQILSKLKKARFSSDEVGKINIDISRYVLKHYSELHHISFGSLKDAIGYDVKDEDLLESVIFLSIFEFPVLQIKYEFIDELENIIQLEKSDVEESIRTGLFAHPETGALLNDFEEYIYMYFEPNPKFVDFIET